jgi:MFS family permease
MFANGIFTRGVALSFLSSIGLLGTTFLLPLYFQLVRGADASSSGFQVIPFLAFSVVGAFSGGQLVRRMGRTKGVIMVGLVAAALGFVGLATVGAASPLVYVVLSMIVVGLGIGVGLPSVLVTVQNAAAHHEVGTATGALLFLRSMGGAFGTTLVGALLTAAFAASLRHAGLPGYSDLSAAKPGGLLAAMGPTAQAAGATALSAGFSLAFGACAVVMVIGLVIAAGLRDVPLRTISGAAPEQPALGH